MSKSTANGHVQQLGFVSLPEGIRCGTTPCNHEPRWLQHSSTAAALFSAVQGHCGGPPVIKDGFLENPEFMDDLAINLHGQFSNFPYLKTPEGIAILLHIKSWPSWPRHLAVGWTSLFSRKMTPEEIFLRDPLRTHRSRPLHPRPKHLWYASSLLEIPPFKAVSTLYLMDFFWENLYSCCNSRYVSWGKLHCWFFVGE